jgi:hypothetical protein
MFGHILLPLILHSQYLDLLPKFLSRQLIIAVLTKPMRLLPPVFPVGQGPPKDVHKLLFPLRAALNARGVISLAVRAGDCLRLVGYELVERRNVRGVSLGLERETGQSRGSGGVVLCRHVIREIAGKSGWGCVLWIVD